MEPEAQPQFYATRSHQDAAAANAHILSFNQWLIILNGSAATSIMLFAADDMKAGGVPLKLVGLSLLLFALGAASGIVAMRYHARALTEWLYHWSVRATVLDADEKTPPDELIGSSYRDAIAKARRHDLFCGTGIVLYLLGCLIFGAALLLR